MPSARRGFPGIGSLGVPPFDAIADPRKYAWVKDDFIGGNTSSGSIGELGWILSGTGATVTTSGEGGHPGIVTLSGLTSDFNGTLALGAGIVTIDDVSDSLVVRYVIKTPASLTNQLWRVGLADDDGDLEVRPGNHISLEYSAADDADDFVIVVDDGTTETEVIAADWIAAPAASTWYTVEFGITPTSVDVWINGLYVSASGPVAVDPDVFTASLTPYITVGDGTNNGTLLVDAFALGTKVGRKGFDPVD